MRVRVFSAKLGAGINLQTTLGGGIGRYLKNTNRASIYVLGGLGWQNVGYGHNTVDHGSQNTAVGFVAGQVKVFKFKKTNLDVSASLCRRSQMPDVFISIERGLLLKFIHDLWWNFSFYGSWDSRPPATLRRATTAPVRD